MLSMRYERLLLAVVLVAVAAVPGHAWLFDAGEPHNAGVMLELGTSVEWAAAPFAVQYDSYATGFGAPVMRGYGPAGAAFAVYVSTDLADVTGSSLASGTLVPTSAYREYKYDYFDQPVFLQAGRPYYLVFIPDVGLYGGISYCLYGYYSQGTADSGQTWGQLPYPLCIQVDGYPVPEPWSLALLAAGFLWVRVRRS